MFKGILIGIGMLLPGVSGGVLAVILGVYEKIIYSINNFKKDVKGNIKFLLPLIIGVIIGAIISAKILKIVFDRYYVYACYAFMGLVLGCVPYLVKDVEKKDKGINYTALIITFAVSILISIISINNNSTDIISSSKGPLSFFFAGLLFISGKIIPGISSSFLLMMIGMYNYFLLIMSNPFIIFDRDIFEIVFLLLGIIIGCLILIKLMGILLKRYYSLTYSAIIGFVIGSVIAIYPEKITIIGIIIFILGFLSSYYFSKIKK